MSERHPGSPGPEPPDIQLLEAAAAWRRRLVDADPGDTASVAAALLLESLAEDLRRTSYASLWGELQALSNWLGESDLISDYADLAADYRARIGLSALPSNGADYLDALLGIARSLI